MAVDKNNKEKNKESEEESVLKKRKRNTALNIEEIEKEGISDINNNKKKNEVFNQIKSDEELIFEELEDEIGKDNIQEEIQKHKLVHKSQVGTAKAIPNPQKIDNSIHTYNPSLRIEDNKKDEYEDSEIIDILENIDFEIETLEGEEIEDTEIKINDSISSIKEEKKEIAFDFSKNQMQKEFIHDVIQAFEGNSPYRYFFFGGAIRGGKTSACLLIVYLYALRYPGCRIHIIRQSAPILSQTTVISFKQLVPDNDVLKWYSNNICKFKNGSTIYFFPESTAQDKDLNRFKGLETNLIFMEQLEELQYHTFQKCIERAGTYRLKDPAPGIILSTFNPTWGWLKDRIHDPHKRGELKAPYYYKTVLPTHNPFLPESLKKQWEDMDEISYKRFILGDWEAKDNTGLFAYSFDPQKHIGKCEINYSLPFWLSFDFNVSPMTCILAQFHKDKQTIRIIREFRRENIGIEEFCTWLKTQIPSNHPIYVTGDPAGNARNALARSNLTYYLAIREVLRLKPDQIKVQSAHPRHENSYVVVNRLFAKHPDFKIDPACKYLIEDLMYVKVNDNYTIDKNTKRKAGEPTIGHLLDCLRYFIHTNFWIAPIRS